MNCGGFLAAVAWPRFATAGTPGWIGPLRSSCCIRCSACSPTTGRRFEIEARAAAGLNHPHIVAVHDSGDHDGTPYIVMERLSERTLSDLIAEGPLPQPQVRSILDDVLSALAAAHAAGILHRDIKPGNILFSHSGDTKLADFGIAKSAATPHTMTGQIVGTMAYLSADRIAGRPATSPTTSMRSGLSDMRRWQAAGRSRRRTWSNSLAPSPRTGLFRWPCCAPTWIQVWTPSSAGRWRASHSGVSTAPRRCGRSWPARPCHPQLAARRRRCWLRRCRTRRPCWCHRRCGAVGRRMMLGLAAAVVAIVIAAAAFIADTASRAPRTAAGQHQHAGSRAAHDVRAPRRPRRRPPPAQVDQGPPGQRNGKHEENGKGPKPKKE